MTRATCHFSLFLSTFCFSHAVIVGPNRVPIYLCFSLSPSSPPSPVTELFSFVSILFFLFTSFFYPVTPLYLLHPHGTLLHLLHPRYTHVTLCTWELTFGLGKQYSNVFDCLTKREIRGSLPQWKVKHLV